jgi:UDP-glucose 4-epimerase
MRSTNSGNLFAATEKAVVMSDIYLDNHDLTVGVLGYGFLGRSLVNALQLRKFNIRVLDHKERPSDVSDQVQWCKATFLDYEAVNFFLEGVDLVYHLVSTSVPGSQTSGMMEELNENITGSNQLLQICLDNEVKRIVFASSAAVYGIQETFPIAESAPVWPISSHGIQKLTLERLYWLANYERRIDARILRISNPYGPGQKIGGKQGFVANVISSLINNESLIIRGTDKVVRDFLYIDDLTQAMMTAGFSETQPILMNISSGIGIQLSEVIGIISKLTGKVVPVKYITGRAVDIPVSVLDPSLSVSTLGDYRVTSLEQGLTKTLQYHGVLANTR